MPPRRQRQGAALEAPLGESRASCAVEILVVLRLDAENRCLDEGLHRPRRSPAPATFGPIGGVPPPANRSRRLAPSCVRIGRPACSLAVRKDRGRRPVAQRTTVGTVAVDGVADGAGMTGNRALGATTEVAEAAIALPAAHGRGVPTTAVTSGTEAEVEVGTVVAAAAAAAGATKPHPPLYTRLQLGQFRSGDSPRIGAPFWRHWPLRRLRLRGFLRPLGTFEDRGQPPPWALL